MNRALLLIVVGRTEPSPIQYNRSSQGQYESVNVCNVICHSLMLSYVVRRKQIVCVNCLRMDVLDIYICKNKLWKSNR